MDTTTPTRASVLRGSSIGPLLLKIVMLGILDAAVVFLLMTLLTRGSYAIFGVVLVGALAVNWVYLSKRAMPAKYITPGLVFLAVFQVFTILYTFYIAFTNYSTGHVLTKDQAIEALLSQSQSRVPDSPQYPVTVVQQGDQLAFLVTEPDGTAMLGSAEQPLEQVDATFTDGKATAVDGWTTLQFTEILAMQDELFDLAVPVSDTAMDGWLRTLDGRSAFQYISDLEYDPQADTLTNTATDVVYSDTSLGAFTAPDGSQMLPGWQINVGLDNFTRAVSEPTIRGPLVYVLIWTFVYATLSVVLAFALGLFMAILFNNPKMKGRKVYRIIMVLPYAFPAFLSTMIWSGMLNTRFGFINETLLGGAEIPWLTDPTLAKVSVLIVNLWLGFPYMFLVTTGALQAIPEEVVEAATTDGASPWQVFRLIKLPLLLVSTAPILISSFAFNFNNFNAIYLVTEGGPVDRSAAIPVGHTDILISLVYKVAFTGQNRDYGLASAFSIIIFVIIASISAYMFRKTKMLEDIN